MSLRKVFLLDGLGAVGSTVFSGLVLPLFSEQIGVPKTILYSLALLALAFSIYSLSCFQFVTKLKPWMLLGIILANILYCVTSVGTVFFLPSLTFLGAVLFSFEVGIIALVVLVEWNVYRKSTTPQKLT